MYVRTNMNTQINAYIHINNLLQYPVPTLRTRIKF